jgi:hypothetical protein
MQTTKYYFTVSSEIPWKKNCPSVVANQDASLDNQNTESFVLWTGTAITAASSKGRHRLFIVGSRNQ